MHDAHPLIALHVGYWDDLGWRGPLALRDGRLDLERSIERSPGWALDRLEVSAFVQDPRTGRVLQALGADHCLATQEADS
ncbi:hypothetical protein [Thiocystis violacea]|uniref:hypothetical protein n=1 Tax=Thiocystis violacea TaxID=13725 RepID=UPI001906F4F7|nr:hypothetical protein [Thiocystis violacea]MBK1721204.1 hypothetical protein [Thiocystis violacea]